MGSELQGNILAMVGGTVLAVGATNMHLRYVRPGMQWLLIISGALILTVGLFDVALAGASKSDVDGASSGASHDQDHDHDRAPLTAWLLVLPVLVMALITPGALGSFSADRSPSRPPALDDRGFLILGEDRDGAVDLSLTDFSARVAYAKSTLDGRKVRLLGFVSPMGSGWAVTRLQISCCAADAGPIKVRAVGPLAANPPPRDSWIEVVGSAAPLEDGKGGEVTAGLSLDSVTPAAKPTETYE